MKIWRLVVLLLVIIALILTVEYWLKPFLKFFTDNGQLIQAIAAGIQIVLSLSTVILVVLGLRKIKNDQKKPTQQNANPERSMHINGKINKSIIIQGVHNVYTKTEKPNPKHMKKAYLSRLFQSCRNLTLTGIDPMVASQSDACLYLDAVYTGLYTLTPMKQNELSAYKDRDQRYMTALEMVNKYDRLVLLGDPGSGKSTFVNFLALCLAGEFLQKERININLLTAPLPDEEGKPGQKNQKWDQGKLLPVRIVLRDFAAKGLPSPQQKATAKHLWDFIRMDLESATLGRYSEHLHQELMKKGGLILLDGLDEVPEADKRRNQIKQVVEDFANTFRNCRILITSRTYAYQKQDWRIQGFQEATLAAFHKGQIIRFIEQWYEHTGYLRSWTAENIKGRAELLKRAVFSQENLTNLAQRPLLLTLMASLHAWRGGSLPEKREELYDNVVDLLLDWWEGQKTVRNAKGEIEILQTSLAEWLKVDRKKVRKLLNRLAFQAHSSQPELQGTADIPEGDLITGLMHMSQNPDINPTQLVDYLQKRAGLLIPRGVGVYTFPHRTFQEYLAACYLTDHEFPDEVADLARNEPERWREVTLLTGAKAARGSLASIWQLAGALCYEHLDQSSDKMQAYWGAHLAGLALTESADLSSKSSRNQEKLSRIIDWLLLCIAEHKLPAIERGIAGISLAHLGDPRKGVVSTIDMPFCYIAKGLFQMGSGSKTHLNKYVDYDYWISVYPVTNGQFNEFVDANGYDNNDFWPEAIEAGIWGYGKIRETKDSKPRNKPEDYGIPFNLCNHPVVGITWYEALAFTRWLETKWRDEKILPPDFKLKLPSEAEWEKAARGGLEIPESPIKSTVQKLFKGNDNLDLIKNPKPVRRYPWRSDKPDPNLANYSDSKINSTNAVGCFPNGSSPYGCEEMSGNVWEWTRSLWGKDFMKPDFSYPYTPDDDRELLTASRDVLRVIRGGSFFHYDGSIECSYRYRFNPYFSRKHFGFRVILSPL